MKKITKRRKKEILKTQLDKMTAFEVLCSIPLGSSSTAANVFTPQKLLNSMPVPSCARSTFYTLFDKNMNDDERLLISSAIRVICERGLLAAEIIENGLNER